MALSIQTAVSLSSAGSCVTFHGAGILHGSGASLFLARSGGGKSTLCAICDQHGVLVTGDDCQLVLEMEGRFYLRPLPRQAGSPPASPPVGERCRITRTFFLVKAGALRVEPTGPIDAVVRCLRQNLVFAFSRMSPNDRRSVLERMIRLFRTVPVYVLQFARDGRFLNVIAELDKSNERTERKAV